MPVILIYNLDNEKGRRIRMICLRLKIRIRSVGPAEYGEPLGALAGLSPRSGTACGSPFGDEMLVFVDFDGPLLDRLLSEMRSERLTVPLKAVLTPANITWSSSRLRDEIAREHAAMQARTKGGQPV